MNTVSQSKSMTTLRYAAYKDSGVPWIGEIPEHWKKVRIKNCIESETNGIWGNDPNGIDDIFCVRVADFNRDRLSISLSKQTFRNIEKIDFYKRALKFGDLLLEKSGGGDKQLVGQSVIFEHDMKAVCSNFISRLRIKNTYSNKFLNYYLSSLYFNRINYKYIKQTTGIQNLDSKSYLSEYIAIPDLNVQNKITRFLDQKTAAIDEAIAKKQRLIELLKEQKAILINRAVTRGLNPDAPMKDSGVDWIGEIPAHWRLSRLGFLGKIGNGSTPNRSNLSYWEKGNIPWLNSSKVNDYHINTAEQFVTLKAFKECHLPLLQPGDIVIGITGQGKTRGMSAICNIKATINQHLAYIHLTSQNISNNYIHLYLSAIYKWMRSESDSSGSTKGAITCQDIKKYPIPLPPLSEQHEIHDYINNKLQSINNFIEIHKSLISTLQEYKQTLIAHAVTGKIKVS